jgi:hypothetical protein
VFQGLDALSKFAEVVNDRTGGDYSAVEFCNVLKYLRKVSTQGSGKWTRNDGQHYENKFWQSPAFFNRLFKMLANSFLILLSGTATQVFLEDAVFRRPTQLTFPVYGHPVFNLGMSNVFCLEESRRVELKEKLWAEKDANLVAQLQDMRAGLEAAHADQVKQLQTALEAKMKDISDGIEQAVSRQLSGEAGGSGVAAAGGGVAAAGTLMSVSSSVGSSDGVLPLPVFPDKVYSITSFYESWVQGDRGGFQRHIDAFKGRPQWSKVWSDSKQISAQKQRYDAVKPFLKYLDSVVFSGDSSSENSSSGVSGAAEKALEVMEGFREANDLTAEKLVKEVVYYMVKFEGGCGLKTRQLATELHNKLIGERLSPPTLTPIQRKTCKK